MKAFTTLLLLFCLGSSVFNVDNAWAGEDGQPKNRRATVKSGQGSQLPLVDSNEQDEQSYWEFDVGFVVGFGKSALDAVNQSSEGYFIGDLWLSGGYYNGNFFAETDPANDKPITFGYTAIEKDDFTLNLIATPYFLGISEDMQERGNTLTGIKTRNPSFDVGIEAMAEHEYGQLGFRALKDVSGTHNGYVLSVVYGYPLYFDKMVVWPSVNLTYLPQKTTDYYYGIRPGEVTEERPLYSAGAGVLSKVNLYIEYELSENTSLIGFSHYTFYNDEISQSPLIKGNLSFAIGVGIIWLF